MTEDYYVDNGAAPTFKDWKENNLCGVCPYRKEVQDRNTELEREVEYLQGEVKGLKEALREWEQT